MAITIVQSATATTLGATTLTATLGATPTDGNLLVVLAFTRTDAGMTGPAGWTVDKDVVNVTSADTARIAHKVASGDAAAVQLTGLSATDATVMKVYEVSGCVTSTPLDASNSTGETVGVATIQTGTTGVLAQTSEIAFALAAIRTTITAPSIDSGFTLETTLSDGVASIEATLLPANKIVSATTALNPAFSWTGAVTAMAIIATFKAATATADNTGSSLPTGRGGRGPGKGPSTRRMMPQQFPVVLPPPVLPALPTPFRIGRGAAMGKPQRRMFPQQYPDTVATPNVTTALTGVASTTGRGTVGVLHTNALAGVSTTTSVGSVKATLTKALSGVSTTTGRGTLGVAHTNALSGVVSVTARGSVGSTRAVPISGVQATGAVGTVTATTGIVVALSGVAATLTVGTMTPSTIAAVRGVQSQGLAGNLTVSGTDTVAQPVSKFRYIIRTKGRLHKSSHREMAELLDRVFSTPDEPSVPAPLAEEVRAIVQPFVYKNELHLAKLEKDMRATRRLLDLWTAETSRMRSEDEDDDETVMLLS